MLGNGGVSGSVLTVKNNESMLPFKTNYSAAVPLLLRRKRGSSGITNNEHEDSATAH
jgi:hypothetical protein